MPLLPTRPTLDIIPPAKRPLPPNQILWPSATGWIGAAGNCDLGQFPELKAVQARMNASPVEPLAAFVEAAAQAEDCILVLDGWLFMPDDALATEARIKQVLDWLPPDTAVNHVKLLTSGGDAFYRSYVDERVAEHVRLINQLNPRRPQPLEAEVNWHLEKNFPRVHDRFAIIDNELWHFGSTVGGLHAKVSAATRGWDAEKHDALRFFREAWAGDSDPGGRRRHG